MERHKAYWHLHELWSDASEKQREALSIAMQDIEFVDLMLKDAVPVQRGRWIEHEIPDEPLYGTDYECSVCGKFHHDNWNYCPDCGAKMDLEEKNEN